MRGFKLEKLRMNPEVENESHKQFESLYDWEESSMDFLETREWQSLKN